MAGATTHAVFDRPSTNFGALRDELGKAAPRPERLNVRVALDAAAAMVAQAAGLGGDGVGPKGEVIIVSDFQRTGWSAADFSVFPRDTEIQLESAAAAETPPNLAVLKVGSSGRAEVGRPLVLDVEVGNFSTASRSVEVELSLAAASYRASALAHQGRRQRSRQRSCREPPGGSQAAPGWSRSATPWPRTIPERLSSTYGSRRSLHSSAARPQPHVRHRATTSSARSSPSRRKPPRTGPARACCGSTRSATIETPSRRPSSWCSIIPGSSPTRCWRSLVGWLKRGRPVLYVACEPADAINLKKWADLAGTDLRLPVELVPPPQGGWRAPRFIAEVRRELPPFQVFGDALTATLDPLRFSGGLASHPLPDALADDVRARYGDQSACLVVSTCGAGTIAILNADLGASTLPTSSAFVPLVGELTCALAGPPRHPTARGLR